MKHADIYDSVSQIVIIWIFLIMSDLACKTATNKKVSGKLKYELTGLMMTEWIALIQKKKVFSVSYQTLDEQINNNKTMMWMI